MVQDWEDTVRQAASKYFGERLSVCGKKINGEASILFRNEAISLRIVKVLDRPETAGDRVFFFQE
jgi:hypothetical protein